MIDPRWETLARTLVRYSLDVKKGETVLLEAFDVPDDFVCLLVAEVAAAGGEPVVSIKRNRVLRALYRQAGDEGIRLAGETERFRMDKVDCYVGIRGSDNIRELSDVPEEGMTRYQREWWKPVHIESRIPGTRWVVLRWPSPSMAQQAGMSTAAFEDFYFSVTNVDYERMSKAMDPLVELMEATDLVRLVAPDTDLRFSILGIPVIKADGHVNIPDGEVFTAPVKDSVEGTIAYNAPSLYQGTEFRDVKFTFKAGKIVAAKANEQEKLDRILDSDEGSRYVGEFAVGLNPNVDRPMLDTLFDEKIAGSIHFTPGNAYDEAFNGNRSEVHWDLVLIQTGAKGGGELWFDDVLVRKDGIFVLPELEPLNP